MTQIIHPPCRANYVPKTNGVIVVEMFMNNTEIYRVWAADLMCCRECYHEIVSGFGKEPIFTHSDGNAREYVEGLKSQGCQIIYWEE